PEVPWVPLMGGGALRRAAEADLYRRSAAVFLEDALATIIYTSGTTGEPRGAMLTHGNIVSDVEACLKVVGIGPTDLSLSFLPLCHIFERMAGLYVMLRAGVTIAYARSMDTVGEDAMAVKPTII